jgi:DnaK suppressor protein
VLSFTTNYRAGENPAAVRLQRMDDADQESIRMRLLQLRSELQAVIATGENSAGVVELDQSRVGRLTRMDALQAQAMAKASGVRRDQMLGKIASALARLERGDYGCCQSCDEPIHPRRLEVDPTAVLCIQCAAKAEG